MLRPAWNRMGVSAAVALLVALLASVVSVGAYPVGGSAEGAAVAPGRNQATPSHAARGGGSGSREVIGEVDRTQLFQLISRIDVSRCFAKWVCDIMARDQQDLAAEEREMALLFTDDKFDEAKEPRDSARFVYFAAAARGRKSKGNREACEIWSCKAKPELMLQMLQKSQLLAGPSSTSRGVQQVRRGRQHDPEHDPVPEHSIEVVEGLPDANSYNSIAEENMSSSSKIFEESKLAEQQMSQDVEGSGSELLATTDALFGEDTIEDIARSEDESGSIVRRELRDEDELIVFEVVEANAVSRPRSPLIRDYTDGEFIPMFAAAGVPEFSYPKTVIFGVVEGPAVPRPSTATARPGGNAADDTASETDTRHQQDDDVLTHNADSSQNTSTSAHQAGDDDLKNSEHSSKVDQDSTKDTGGPDNVAAKHDGAAQASGATQRDDTDNATGSTANVAETTKPTANVS